MKKGLLSLLALALTVVGCQNYDDQFDALTELIEGVQSDVDGLSALQSDVDALAATISGLATAESVSGLASSISDVEEDVAGVAASVSPLAQALADLEGDVAALQTAIDNAATAAEVAALQTALNAVQDDVTELLAANNVIDQNLSITNVANLEYVEGLIATEDDDPAAIINGTFTVKSAFAKNDQALIDRINAVTGKIKTVLNDLSVTHSTDAVVNFPLLAFVDADVTINTANTLDALATITGNFDLNVAGDIVANALTSAGSVEVSAKLTSLDLTGVTITNALSTKGSGTGIIYAPAATGAINAGTAQVTRVLADKATSVILGADDHFDLIDIDADAATAITIANESVNDLQIDADDATVVTADALTKVGTITTDEIEELHLATLATVSSSIVATVDSALDIPLLKSITNTSSIDDLETFNAPVLSLTTTLTLAEATSVTVKNIADQQSSGQNRLVAGKVETLTISEMGADKRLDVNGDYAKLETLSVTGKDLTVPTASTQTSSIVIVAAATELEDVTLDGQIDYVSVTSNTDITDFTTAATAEIRYLELTGNTKLANLTLDHAHIDGSDGAELHFVNNDKVTALTASNFDEAEEIHISGNMLLASLSFPSLDTPITSSTASITVDDNYLTGTYVTATASTPTTPYAAAKLKANSLVDLVRYVKAMTTTPTYYFDIARVTSQTQTSAGVVNATATYSNTLANIINGDTALPETGINTGIVTGTSSADSYFITRIIAE